MSAADVKQMQTILACCSLQRLSHVSVLVFHHAGTDYANNLTNSASMHSMCFLSTARPRLSVECCTLHLSAILSAAWKSVLSCDKHASMLQTDAFSYSDWLLTMQAAGLWWSTRDSCFIQQMWHHPIQHHQMFLSV